jgi:hypothetical protein
LHRDRVVTRAETVLLIELVRLLELDAQPRPPASRFRT